MQETVVTGVSDTRRDRPRSGSFLISALGLGHCAQGQTPRSRAPAVANAAARSAADLAHR